MTEEIDNLPEDVSGFEVEVTDPSESVSEDLPPEEQETSQENESERKFTQSQLNEIVQRAKAKERAKAERELVREVQALQEAEALQQRIQKDAEIDKPIPDQFSNVEDYTEALAEWHYLQKVRVNEALQENTQREMVNQKIANRIHQVLDQAKRNPSFDESIVGQLDLTEPMLVTIISSEDAPRVLDYCTKHPEEVTRISRLPMARQAAEIGKIEAKISTMKRTRDLPEPLDTVRNRGSSTDLANGSYEHYKAARRKQGASWGR